MRKTFQFNFIISLAAAALLLSNCSNPDNLTNQPPAVTAFSTNAPLLTKTTILNNLQNPWDIAFTPDGAMLYTEKCNGLSVVRADGQKKRLFGAFEAALVASDLFCEGQSGAAGIAVDPDFANNRTVYVYMSSSLLMNPRTNRVVRLTLASDYSTAANRTDIVTDIPFKHVGTHWGGAGSHSGGRLRFGPDGFLYISTGDNHNGTLPQDLSRLGGKVLRVDRNGQAAPGNNTPAGGDPRIFTYGHRNIQGLCFHPDTLQPYIAEHGPNHSDEVTMIMPGGNGGWDPKPDAGVSCQDNYCGYTSNNREGTLTPMTDLRKFPNALIPVLTLDDSQGIGPCEFLSGPQWKGWDRGMVVGVMGATRLDVAKIPNASAPVNEKVTANLPADRVRATVQGPDGNLYIATDSGEIWKVVPTP